MLALVCFLLRLLGSPLKSNNRLEAENAALRHQLIVLQRKIRGRIQFTNSDRLFLHPGVSMVSVDPQVHDGHATRDARALAPCGLSPLLALEISQPGRPAANQCRLRAVIRRSALKICFGVHHAFMASYSSSALWWLSRPSPSTCQER